MNTKYLLWLVAGYLVYDMIQKKKVSDAAVQAQSATQQATNQALQIAQQAISSI